MSTINNILYVVNTNIYQYLRVQEGKNLQYTCKDIAQIIAEIRNKPAFKSDPTGCAPFQYNKVLEIFNTIVKDIDNRNYRVNIHWAILTVLDSFSNEIKVFIQKEYHKVSFSTILKMLQRCEDFVEQTIAQEEMSITTCFREYAKQLKELDDTRIKLLFL